MPTPKKKTSGVDVQSIFAQAAQREIPVRAAREQAAREDKRRDQLAAEKAERERLEKLARDSAFETEMTTNFLPSIKTMIDNAFGEKGRFRASLSLGGRHIDPAQRAQPHLVIETRSNLGNYYDHTMRMTLVVKDGALHKASTGRVVEPQLRDFYRQYTPEEATNVIAGNLAWHADKPSLKKLAKAKPAGPKP